MKVPNVTITSGDNAGSSIDKSMIKLQQTNVK